MSKMEEKVNKQKEEVSCELVAVQKPTVSEVDSLMPTMDILQSKQIQTQVGALIRDLQNPQDKGKFKS